MKYFIKLFFFLSFFLSFSSQAVVIDTTSTWGGAVNSGWLGSGQSFTIDSVDTYFDDISFSFSNQSNGQTFDFVLSDSLNGGVTLFSTSFTVNSGVGFIDINTDLVAGSSVYALIDYNGYSGSSAYYQNNVYSGGNSNFGANGSKTDFSGLDHVFIANFTGGAAIPEPSIIALMGLGLFGLSLSRRRMK